MGGTGQPITHGPVGAPLIPASAAGGSVWLRIRERGLFPLGLSLGQDVTCGAGVGALGWKSLNSAGRGTGLRDARALLSGDGLCLETRAWWESDSWRRRGHRRRGSNAKLWTEWERAVSQLALL